MKHILTSLLLVCLHSIALSQEYTATFGKNPTCHRQGGICTMKPGDNANKSAKSNNVSILQTKDGTTMIRIYRERLTQEEEDRIFGAPITAESRNNLQFVMHEAIDLPPEIVSATDMTKSRQIQTLEAKNYPVVISDKFIDITIVPRK